MKEELDNILCKKYPLIFAQRNMPMTQTAMCWGFDHDNGWFNILNQLCMQIQGHIDWQNRETEVIPQVVATQVKQKYGTLRFYYSGGDEVIDGMVRMAEAMSAVTCEVCGDVGKVRNDNAWVYTSCDKHSQNVEESNGELF